MKVLFSDSDIQHLLRQRGKQAATAHEAGVSEAHLSKVINGHSLPGPKLLSLLGFEQVHAYDVKEKVSG